MLTSVRAWLDRAAFGACVLSAATLGFERIEPSLPLTPDLRLTNVRALVLLTIVLWLLARLSGGRTPRLPPKAVSLACAVWLSVLLVSALLAPTHQTFALAFVRDMTLGAVFGWAVYDLTHSSFLRQLGNTRAFALGGFGVAFAVVLESTGNPAVQQFLNGFRYVPSFSVADITRASGTLPHPNIAAMFLALAIPLQLAWLASTVSWSARVGLGLALGASLAAVVLTLSRAGVLVVAVELALLLAAGLGRRAPALVRSSLASAVALVVLVGGALVAEPDLRLRLQSETPQGWYRAAYATPPTLRSAPGEATRVPVRISNTGQRGWAAAGTHPFALSYHVVDAGSGAPVNYDGVRTPLPSDVPPGASVELEAQVLAPQAPGTYVVEWDGVEESVTWFSWAGAPSAQTVLTVAGTLAPAAVAAETASTPPPLVETPAPPRLTLWRIALRMARNRPLLGQGPDNFRWVYGDFAELSTWDTGVHANSLYFELLADTGLPGLFAFAWFAYELLRFATGAIRPSAGTWMWRVALLVSLVAWFLHGLVDYFYGPLPTNMAFWLIAALAVAASARSQITSAH